MVDLIELPSSTMDDGRAPPQQTNASLQVAKASNLARQNRLENAKTLLAARRKELPESFAF